jgi:hypothetical protein
MEDHNALRENWRLIKTPIGEAWSGRTRYAAAAWLYKNGLMDPGVLETYRILSRLDDEDPHGLLIQTPEGRAWAQELNKSTELDDGY